MTYGDFKELARRIAADKFLRDKAFNLAKDPKYDGYQIGLASTVYKFFNIKSMPQNQQLAEELQKPFIRKLKKWKVYSSTKDNIWGRDDLSDIQLISKFHKRFRFSLCFINIFKKNA